MLNILLNKIPIHSTLSICTWPNIKFKTAVTQQYSQEPRCTDKHVPLDSSPYKNTEPGCSLCQVSKSGTLKISGWNTTVHFLDCMWMQHIFSPAQQASHKLQDDTLHEAPSLKVAARQLKQCLKCKCIQRKKKKKSSRCVLFVFVACQFTTIADCTSRVTAPFWVQ